MRVVVFGATGNVGSALCQSLSADPAVDSIVGVARRLPERELAKVEWRTADVSTDELTGLLDGADAAVHLAWLIQPSRDEATLSATNVEGSRRVFEAVRATSVPRLVYASSIGTYSPGPKDEFVDESWPTEGIRTSFYSRHKAEVERLIRELEADEGGPAVVTLRPGLIFRRESATGIRRLFLGPVFPNALADPRLIPLVPELERLRIQAVHSEDVAEAFRLALTTEETGAYNVAADPVIDPDGLADFLGARKVGLAPRALRGAATASWKLHLQPSPPGWVDLALETPLMDTSRARTTLGWTPTYTAYDALDELLDGLRSGAGLPTPPLDPRTSGRFRVNELRTGIGHR